jgi:hypothetical protein
MQVDFGALGLGAPGKVRDVWAAKDLGPLGGYRAAVPAHGVVLLRISPA